MPEIQPEQPGPDRSALLVGAGNRPRTFATIGYDHAATRPSCGYPDRMKEMRDRSLLRLHVMSLDVGGDVSLAVSNMPADLHATKFSPYPKLFDIPRVNAKSGGNLISVQQRSKAHLAVVAVAGD